jgi:hypothetical protein
MQNTENFTTNIKLFKHYSLQFEFKFKPTIKIRFKTKKKIPFAFLGLFQDSCLIKLLIEIVEIIDFPHAQAKNQQKAKILKIKKLSAKIT